MSEKLAFENYLLVLKSTVEVYVHGTLESSNINNRVVLKSGLDKTMISQADTYDMMVKYGWYKVNNIKTSEITKTLKKVKEQ